jgi:predicted RNA-binding Zn-ribbon protein involved in translation (DUF1610 family)
VHDILRYARIAYWTTGAVILCLVVYLLFAGTGECGIQVLYERNNGQDADVVGSTHGVLFVTSTRGASHWLSTGGHYPSRFAEWRYALLPSVVLSVPVRAWSIRDYWAVSFPLYFMLLPWALPLARVAHSRRKQARNPTLCHGCEYDLRGSASSDRCPECGRAIDDADRARIREGIAQQDAITSR